LPTISVASPIWSALALAALLGCSTAPAVCTPAVETVRVEVPVAAKLTPPAELMEDPPLPVLHDPRAPGVVKGLTAEGVEQLEWLEVLLEGWQCWAGPWPCEAP